MTIKGPVGKPDLSFLPDGTLKSVELKIMNLRPGLWSNLVWEEVLLYCEDVNKRPKKEEFSFLS